MRVPVVFLVACHLFQGNVTAESNGGNQFKDTLKYYMDVSNNSRTGCNIEAARKCFWTLSNSTIYAMYSDNSATVKKQVCRDIWESNMCLENHTKGCPAREGEERLMDPYVSIMKTIAETACHQNMDKDDWEALKKDNEECKSMEVGMCMSDFFHVAVEVSSMYTPFAPKATLCWQVGISLSCMSSAMGKCGNQNIRSFVGMIAAQMKITQKAVCAHKKGCDVDRAKEMLWAAGRGLNSPLSLTKGSPLLCGFLTYYLQEVTGTINDCPMEVYQNISGMISIVSLARQSVCEANPELKMPVVPMMDEIISVGAVANSPFVSKEAICPMFEMASKMMLQMKDKMISSDSVLYTLDVTYRMMEDLCVKKPEAKQCMYTESDMCDVERAKTCVNQVAMGFLLENVNYFGWETMCQEVDKMTKCMQYMTNGCKDKANMTIEHINPRIQDYFALVADHCPVTDLLASRQSCDDRQCDIHKAMTTCFKMHSEEDFTSGKICSLANMTVNCVFEHTRGCGMLRAAHPVAYALKGYLDWVKPYCMNPALDDLLRMLPACSTQYVDGLWYVMVNSHNFTRDICMYMDYRAAKKECADISHEPAINQFSMMQSYKMMEKYYLKTCMSGMRMNMTNESTNEKEKEEDKNMDRTASDRTEETSKDNMHMMKSNITEPASCNAEIAASCITSYWYRLIEVGSLPLTQRKQLCSDYHMVMKPCVMYYSANCSETRRTTMKHAVAMVTMIQDQVCPMMEWHMDNNTCNVNTSLSCLTMLGEYLGTASGFRTRSPCGKVKMAMECVYNNTKTCGQSDLDTVHDAMAPILSVVGHSCKVDNEEECNVTKEIANRFMPSKCDQTAVTECWSWFNSAKTYLSSHALCGAAYQLHSCVQVHSKGCDAAFIDAQVTKPLNSLQSELSTVCKAKDNMENATHSCANEPLIVPCMSDLEMCFPSFKPEEVCGNRTAVQSCINLMLKGCDKFVVYTASARVKYVQSTLESVVGSGSCDLMPSASLTTLPPVNSTNDPDCFMMSDAVAKEYLYNNSATEKNLCSAFEKMAKCLMADHNLSPTWKKIMYSLGNIIKHQIHFRCNLAEGMMDMVYKDEVKDVSAFNITNSTCKPEDATVCLFTYMHINVFSAFIPLSQRVEGCGKRNRELMCIKDKISACPAPIKMKALRALDWVQSMGQVTGVCREDQPRKCDPHKAINTCVALLSQGIMKYKDSHKSAVCAGVVPTEICVKHHIQGCDSKIRLSVENTYRQVIGVAMKTCTMTEKERMQVEYKESMCDMMKVKHCMTTMFNEVAMATLEPRDKQKMCRNLSVYAECVEKHSMSCEPENKMKVDSMKPTMMALFMGACSEETEKEDMETEKEDMETEKEDMETEKEDMETEKEDMEAATCKMTAVWCMRDYVEVSMAESLSAYCRQVPTTKMCLADAQKSCNEKVGNLVGMVTDHIDETYGKYCQARGCNMELATKCLMETDMLVKMPPKLLKESPVWCGAAKQSLNCAYRHGMSCQKDKGYPMMKDWFLARHSMVENMCAKNEPAPNPVIAMASSYNMDALMSMLSMLSSPHITKEAICPQYKYMMSKLFEYSYSAKTSEEFAQFVQVAHLPIKIVGRYCDEKSDRYLMSNDTEQCDVDAAFKCAEEAKVAEARSKTIFYGWTPVCGALLKMSCCMDRVAGGCYDYKSVKAIHSLASEIWSGIGDHCSARDISMQSLTSCAHPKPKKCELTNAISKCTIPLGTPNDKQKICTDLGGLVECVKKYTEGCSAYQNAPLAWVLKKYKDWMRSQCDLSRISTEVLVQDETADASNCSMVFMDAFYSSLTRSVNLNRSYCDAMEVTHMCQKQSKYLPMTLQYHYAEDMKESDKFKKMECNKTSTITAPSEPSTCMKDVAAMCFTSYSKALMDWRLIPLEERAGFCSKALDVINCVQNAIQTCSQATKDMFNEGLYMMDLKHMEVCPSILPEVAKRDYVCKAQMAKYCIRHFGMHLSEATPGSEEKTCRAFEKTLHCVYVATKNCSDEVKNTLAPELTWAKNMLGDSCSLLSTVMCNTAMWNTTLLHSTCNKEKAYMCLRELDSTTRQNMTDRRSFCTNYHRTLECVMQNGMTCNRADVRDINTTIHIIMSNVGTRCMDMASSDKDARSSVTTMDYPILQAVSTCKPQPECSVMWNHCIPSENMSDVCRLGSKAYDCIEHTMRGCENETKLSVLRSLRMFANNIAMTHNKTCNFSEVVMQRTAPLVQYMRNDTCDIMFGHQLMTVMRNESASQRDVCHLFEYLQKCLEREMMYMPAIFKGIWTGMAHNIEENKCSMPETEMNKKNMTDMEKEMTKMASYNMSMLYNMTMKEAASCDSMKAGDCLYHLSSSVIYGSGLPLKDRKMMCRDRAKYQKCIVHSTASCSSKLRIKFLYVSTFLNKIGQSQGICQNEASVAREPFRAEVMKMECRMDKAVECLGMLSLSLTMNSASKSKKVVCSHLLPVEMCIAKHTYRCLPSQRMSIEATYRNLKAVALSMCHSQPVKTTSASDKCMSMTSMPEDSKMCSLPEAVFCITSMHSKVMKMSDQKDAICGMIPDLRTCIWKHASGCEMNIQEGIYNLLTTMYKRLSKTCPSIWCDTCAAVWHIQQLNKTRNEKSPTCLEVYKARQMVDYNLMGCSAGESRMVKHHLQSVINKVATRECAYQLTFTQCAVHFAHLAQGIIGVSEDMMPKELVSEINKLKMMMAAPNKDSEELKILKKLSKVMESMMPSQECHKPYTMATDKMGMCAEIKSVSECLKTHIHQIPKEKIPAVNATMHLIGHLMMEKCEEKPLKCYSCRNAKSNEECNKQPMETCMGENQMCYTKSNYMMADIRVNTTSKITTETRSANMDDKEMDKKSNYTLRLINKGCASRVPLLQQDTKCQSDGRCHYNCYKSDCNYDAYYGTRDPPSCDAKMAAVCGMHLVTDFLMDSEGIDCSKMKKHLNCMYHHTQECMSSNARMMFKYAEQLAQTPAMVKCYAEPHTCKCGRCLSLTFAKVATSPVTQPEDVCKAVMEAQMGVMSALITFNECSKEDMENMKEATKLGRALLGDMCSMPVIGAKYDRYCNMDAAKACMMSANLTEYAMRYKAEHVCGMAKRMFYCAYMNVKNCDMMSPDIVSMAAKMNEVVRHLKNKCDMPVIEKALNTTLSTAGLTSDNVKKIIDDAFSKVEVDKERMMKLHDIVASSMDPNMTTCKPSLAMHHCFYYFEVVPKSDYCRAASESYACIDMLTNGCLAIQKAPVHYLYYNFLSADPKMCGFSQMMEDMNKRMAMEKDPYHTLSTCASNYTWVVQQAYSSQFTQNTTMKLCEAAAMLDMCVYNTKVPATDKVVITDMAMLTKEILWVSCKDVDMDMSKEMCKEDDVVCMIMKNHSMAKSSTPVTSYLVDLSTEPSTCEVYYAAGCMGNYLMRVITSSYAPINEYADICWERKYMEECVVSKTQSCSFNRKQMFMSTVSWFKNITNPVCKMVTDMENPNCTKAQHCIDKAMYHMVSEESYRDMGDFCWGAKKIMKCVEHHAPNCTTVEMPDIIQGLQLMGNVTHHMCPKMDSTICPLTKMAPGDPRVSCNLNNMRMCVHNFYNVTYNNKLSESQYCSLLDRTASCIQNNSTSCHPGFMKEMHGLMMPGILKAGVNCSIIVQMTQEATSCPIVGNCSVTDIISKIDELYFKINEARKTNVNYYPCNDVANLMSELIRDAANCSSLENSIVNYYLEQVHLYVGTSTRCPSQVRTLSDTATVMFDNSDYAQCATLMAQSLTTAMKSPKYGIYDICESASRYNSCLSSLLHTAKSPLQKAHAMLMRRTYTNLQHFLNMTCATMDVKDMKQLQLPTESTTCLNDVAMACTAQFTMRVMNVGMLRSHDIMGLCRSRINYYRCIGNRITTCSVTVKAQVYTMYTLADSMLLASGKCPKDVVEAAGNYNRMSNKVMKEMKDPMMHDYAVQLAMGLLKMRVTGQSKMKHNMMGDMKSRMGEMDSRIAPDMESKMANSTMGKCDARKAYKCIGYVVSSIFNVEKQLFSGMHFCSHLKWAESCVMENLRGCRDNELMYFEMDTIMSLNHVAMKICKAVVQEKMMIQNLTRVEREFMANMTKMMSGSMPENTRDMMSDDDAKSVMEMNVNMTRMTDSMMSMNRSQNQTMMDDAMSRDKTMMDDAMSGDKMNDAMSNTDVVSEVRKRMKTFMSEKMMTEKLQSGEGLDAIMKLLSVAPEDGHCVDPKKYREYGRCDPAMVDMCIKSVEMEMLSPFSTPERLCLKQNLAARCYAAMSHGCDYLSKMMMNTSFSYMMWTVGKRCPTVMKSPCMEPKTEWTCQKEKVHMCLENVHRVVTAGKDFLPHSASQMCMESKKAAECLMSKLRHCDAKTQYSTWDGLRPVTETLDYICNSMPAMGCVASFMWKSASSVLLKSDIAVAGKILQAMKYYQSMNMTMPEEVLKHLTKDMEDKVNNSNSAWMKEAVHWMGRMTDKSPECHNASKSKQMQYGMEDVLRSVAGLIKLAKMESNMIPIEKKFVEHVEVMIKSEEKNSIMRMSIDVINRTMMEYGIHISDSYLTRQAVKYIVQMADSTKMMNFAFTHIAKMKLEKGMAAIGMKMKMQKETEDEMERDMKSWMMKEVAEKFRSMLPDTRIFRDQEYTMKHLQMQIDTMRMKAASSCYELMEAGKCIESYSHLIPEQTRPVLNMSVQMMIGSAKQYCTPIQCFQCNGGRSNGWCNKQGMKTCKIGESCITIIKKGQITKGCSFPADDYEDMEQKVMTCSNSYCNMALMMAYKENVTVCQPNKGVQCLMDLIPGLVTSRYPSMREINKASACMMKSTKGCYFPEHKMVGDMGKKLKQMTYDGICAGDWSEYECGLRSVLGLSTAVNNPMSTRQYICYELNETLSIVSMAMMNKKCSEHELIQVHQGLTTVMQTIGSDFCPGIKTRDPKMCHMMENNKTSTCNLPAVHKCMDGKDMLLKLVMMSEYDKVKAASKARQRDYDHVCKEFWEFSECVSTAVSNCSESVIKEVTKNATMKFGFFIKHCPVSNMVNHMCSPLEMKPAQCDVWGATTKCFGKFTDLDQMCSVTSAELTATMTCIKNYTSGCSAIQNFPIVDLAYKIVGRMGMRCGGLYNVLRNQMDAYNIGYEMMVRVVTEFNEGFKSDSDRNDKPMSKLLDILLNAKIVNSAKNMTLIQGFLGLPQTLYNMTYEIEKFAHIVMASDETKGIVKCSLELTLQIERALRYPTWFNMVMCEATTTAQKCYAKLSLSPVAQMNLYTMMGNLAVHKEEVCSYYMDHVMMVGHVLKNMTMAMKSASHGRLSEIIGLMMNGSLDKVNVSSQELSALLSSSIGPVMDAIVTEKETCDVMNISVTLTQFSNLVFMGPFTPYADYRSLCGALNYYLDMTIVPKIKQCSQKNQEYYMAFMKALQNITKDACKLPAVNTYRDTSCKPDQAMMCVKHVTPYLSSTAVDTTDLCKNYHMTLMCIAMNTQTCSTEQMSNVTLVMNHINSVVGNSCPYITAARQCISNAQTAGTCDVNKAKSCTSVFGDLEKITADTCLKIPEFIQCTSSQSIGCSPAEVNDVFSYFDVLLARKLLLCYSDTTMKRMSPLLYSQSSCQTPAMCSLKAATKCYDRMAATGICSDQDAREITACVANSLRGCGIMQINTFKASLWLGKRVSISCDAFTLDSSLTPTDQQSRAGFEMLSSCTETFQQNLTNALMTPINAHIKICHVMESMYSCLMKGMDKESQAYMSMLYGHPFNVTTELTMKVCDPVFKGEMKMEPERAVAGPKDASKCHINVAAGCLATYTVGNAFAGSMNMEDKADFCNENGSYAVMIRCVYDALSGCSEDQTSQFAGFGKFVQAVRELSAICDPYWATCSPTNAANCGMKVSERMKMQMQSPASASSNRSVTADGRSNMTDMNDMKSMYCRWFEESVHCARMNTYGCSAEVKKEVVKGFEESYCLGNDVFRDCGKTKMAKMPEVPKCQDKKAMGNESCNVSTAFTCIKMLHWEMENLFMDCNYMQGPYTSAMQCYERHTKNCPSSTKAVLTSIAASTVEMVMKKCPMIPNYSCDEPESCQVDQAYYCVEKLGKLLSNYKKLEVQHMCMAVDATEGCVFDRTRHCTSFAKTQAYHTLEYVKKLANLTKQSRCADTMEYCLHKFYYSAAAVIQGEAMMTKIAMHRNNGTQKVMSAFMSETNKDPVMMDSRNMMDSNDKMNTVSMMDSISSMAVHKTMEYYKNMTKMTLAPNSSEAMMSHFGEFIMDMMTRDMMDHFDIYAKMKAMECMSVSEAFKCIFNGLNSTSLKRDVASFLEYAGSHMFIVVDEHCKKEMSTDLLDESASCQILGASVRAMQQIGSSVMNMTAFCQMLPDSISWVDSMTVGCKNKEINYHFSRVVASFKEAKDTMCRTRSLCQSVTANKCVSDFQTNPSCSAYETALQCLTSNLKDCDADTSSKLRSSLQAEYDKISSTCQKLPAVKMSVNSQTSMRIIEGGSEQSVSMLLSQSPEDTCDAGKTCKVQVEVQLVNNAVTIPTCPDTREKLAQVVVQKTGNADPCSHTFTSANWKETMNIPLYASSDLVYDKTQDVNMTITAKKFANNELVLERQIANMKLVVADTEQPAVCAAFNSYIVTFDGKTIKNRYQREFTLYKHATMPYEVHVINQGCRSKTRTCTCAAMVKSVDDVIVVDRCSKSRSNLREPIRMFRNGELTSGTKVYMAQDGKFITVTLPTGTSVKILTDNNNRLKVFVVPSSLDWINTEGLCGFYDANKQNDMRMPVTGDETTKMSSFIKGWRTNAGDSLYIGAPSDNTYQHPMYCTCTAANGVVQNKCEPMLIAKSCDVSAGLQRGKDITAQLVSLSVIESRRRKRAVEDPWAGLSDININFVPQETDLTVSASGNWTTVRATQYCENVLKDSQCDAFVGNSFKVTLIDTCVQTILQNDRTSDVSVKSVYETHCVTVVSQYETASQNDPAFVSQKDQILKAACPNDCSSNGQCNEQGTCSCFRDYIGEDCSIHMNNAPVISSSEADRLCSLSSSNCKTVMVSGGPFTEELTPSCHFQKANMDGTTFESVVKAGASFLDSTLMICTIPDAMATTNMATRAVSVAVSNDGEHISQPVLYVAYHPLCYWCNTTSSCTRITNSGCVIGNVCYASNAVNPQTNCEFCDPVTDTTGWTGKLVPGCPGHSIASSTQTSTTITTTTTPTPANPNGNAGQGQNIVCSTPAPVKQTDTTLAVILGAFAALFFLTTVLLLCKVCRQSSNSSSSTKKSLSTSSRSSESASSIEDQKKDYDNLGFESFGKTKNVYSAGPVIDTTGAPTATTNPIYKDSARFEDESATSTPL